MVCGCTHVAVAVCGPRCSSDVMRFTKINKRSSIRHCAYNICTWLISVMVNRFLNSSSSFRGQILCILFYFRLPSNNNVFLDFNLHQAHEYKNSERVGFEHVFLTKNRYRLIIILVNKIPVDEYCFIM